MNTREVFKFIRDEIHTTVFATNDSNGQPVTCVIDIMLAKDEKLYFITAKGKKFYQRLISNGYVAFSGLIGEDTLSSVSVNIKGHVRDVGSELVREIFDKNDYMKKIYANEESMKVLTVFEMYKGEGEYFDLSKLPIDRFSFSFGGEKIDQRGIYQINEKCSQCGICLKVCPSSCIEKGQPYKIISENCLHCGSCFEVCEFGAVDR